MTDISRHPLLTQAYEVCQEIEKCGASPELTAAVSKASALLQSLDTFIPINANSAAATAVKAELFQHCQNESFLKGFIEGVVDSEPAPIVMQLQELCADYGCPGGVNRFAWLRSELDVMAQIKASNRSEDGYDFSEALIWAREGLRIQRSGWNGKEQYVKWIPGFGSVIEFEGCEVAGCFALKNAQGVVQPGWVPSQGDLMAMDWRVVD